MTVILKKKVKIKKKLDGEEYQVVGNFIHPWFCPVLLHPVSIHPDLFQLEVQFFFKGILFFPLSLPLFRLPSPFTAVFSRSLFSVSRRFPQQFLAAPTAFLPTEQCNQIGCIVMDIGYIWCIISLYVNKQ